MITCIWLLVVTLIAITGLFATPFAQSPPVEPGGTAAASIEVDDDGAPDKIVGPLGRPANFEITNDGPADVTLYVKSDESADSFPEDWELGDPLPEGWSEGATLEEGESTTIGAGTNGSIHGHSHANGGSEVSALQV